MKDARFFPHDSNASNDPKIVCLINKYGFEAYGRYWNLIETLRNCDEYCLCVESFVMEALSCQMKMKNAQEASDFIEYLKTIQLLAGDGSKIFSPALNKKMQQYDEKRAERSEHARTAATKRWSKYATQTPESKDETIKNLIEAWNGLATLKPKFKKVEKLSRQLSDAIFNRLNDATFARNISQIILYLVNNEVPIEYTFEDVCTSEAKFNSIMELMQ